MMFTYIFPRSWRQIQRFIGFINGVLLFLMLLVAIWLATQRREAPQLILLLLLYVITVNFSLPPAQGAVGLVPVVSVTSALVVDLETAILLAALLTLPFALFGAAAFGSGGLPVFVIYCLSVMLVSILKDLAANARTSAKTIYFADDLTGWVINERKALDLNEQNMHFAGRHDLKLPEPRPSAWLGVPLQAVDRAIGALVVQRYPPSPSFNRWSREVLPAVAGQASAAIQNARLYQETLRLYSSTDDAVAQRLRQSSMLVRAVMICSIW